MESKVENIKMRKSMKPEVGSLKRSNKTAKFSLTAEGKIPWTEGSLAGGP